MGGIGYRLTLVSGTSPLNNSCAGIFSDRKIAYNVAELLMAMDRMDSPEYKSFVVDEVRFAILTQLVESGCADVESIF